jgi:hypothetical protein
MSVQKYAVGFKFIGTNDVEFTVTEIKTVNWDDAAPMFYVTVTDGYNFYTFDQDELNNRVAL